MGGSLWETFEATAQQFSHRTALIYLGTEYTYAELLAMAERLAASLRGLGVKKGDRVIIYQSHCPQWVIAWFAILRNGAVAVPVTHFYKADDLGYIARDSEAEILFCTEANFAAAVEAARAGTRTGAGACWQIRLATSPKTA
jgi:acyl-CoA synthetase (AMP-forming)/AMP-acid ligase II